MRDQRMVHTRTGGHRAISDSPEALLGDYVNDRREQGIAAIPVGQTLGIQAHKPILARPRLPVGTLDTPN